MDDHTNPYVTYTPSSISGFSGAVWPFAVSYTHLVISIDPRSLTPGNTWQYNFGVQRELDKVTKVDVNWIQSWSCLLYTSRCV